MVHGWGAIKRESASLNGYGGTLFSLLDGNVCALGTMKLQHFLDDCGDGVNFLRRAFAQAMDQRLQFGRCAGIGFNPIGRRFLPHRSLQKGLMEQILPRHSQRSLNLERGFKGRLALPAFQQADVVARQPRPFRQGFLAQSRAPAIMGHLLSKTSEGTHGTIIARTACFLYQQKLENDLFN